MKLMHKKTFQLILLIGFVSLFLSCGRQEINESAANENSANENAAMESNTLMAAKSKPKIKKQITAMSSKSAVVLDFKKSDYDAAINSSKLVVLYFYADWCPICKKEFPVM